MEATEDTRLAVLEVSFVYEKEINLLRSEKDASALKLQAIETERRLENLNHEAAKLKEMQATYLPRETHDLEMTRISERREADEKARDDQVERIKEEIININLILTEIKTRITTWGGFLGLALLIINTLIGIFMKMWK